jgi:hypothetical protein
MVSVAIVAGVHLQYNTKTGEFTWLGIDGNRYAIDERYIPLYQEMYLDENRQPINPL